MAPGISRCPARSIDDEQQTIRGLAEDDRLIHWFIENRDEVLPKTSSLPVGYVFVDEPTNLVHIVEPSIPLADRPMAALCAHIIREGPQWEVRGAVTRLCRERFQGFVTVVDEELSPHDFLSAIRKHPFALCVQGGGLDPSPKAWTCIANGTIPIIKSSPLDDAYQQLPVAFVEDWDEDCLSLERLSNWIDTLSPFYEDPTLRAETLNKLSLDYWWSNITADNRE